MADNIKNFAYSTVLTAPTPAASGTSLVVQGGDGTKFPTVPFNATVWPVGVQPTTTNAEIVRVTAISTDTFTITRTQESTSARTIVVGDQIAATITAKALTDRASLADANNYSAAQNEAKGADIASATTTDIGAATGNYVVVTGTTTITGLGTIQAGTRRIVKFAGILTLTYNATSLILPTSANITTAADDTAVFVSLGGGNWVCTNYQRKNGTALASSGGTTPTMKMATIYEGTGRMTTTNVSGGTATFTTDGVAMSTSATISSATTVDWSFNTFSATVEVGSPVFTAHVLWTSIGTDVQSYVGIGSPTVAGSGITFTVKHIGFKLIRAASGAINLYATQADGTTENVSAVLTTVAAVDELDLILKVNGSSSVDYYWRKNGGALSSTTNLTSNMPVGLDGTIRVAVTNAGVATNTNMRIQSSSYER